MYIDLFTIFPEVFRAYLGSSILGRARQSGALHVAVHDIRAFAKDRHRVTDDAPYGGGGGMVMKPEPIFAAVESVLGAEREAVSVILLTPQGRLFSQSVAREMARRKRMALIAGRYEGVDERVRKHLATDEVSMGDYVLTGGELPALTLIDAVTRLLPGVLGDPGAAARDSHGNDGLLEHPHYTRPVEFRGWRVPDALLSGDHAGVALWRRQQALRRTWRRRPELLLHAQLSEQEKEWLAELSEETATDEKTDSN